MTARSESAAPGARGGLGESPHGPRIVAFAFGLGGAAALGPLAGLPVSIKDLFDEAGQVTRAGSQREWRLGAAIAISHDIPCHQQKHCCQQQSLHHLTTAIFLVKLSCLPDVYLAVMRQK